jgi:hypothetical protein
MSYSFDIKNSIDLYQEFLQAYEEYQQNLQSSGKAVVCAILAWHVIEWIYGEYSEELQRNNKKKDFQQSIKDQCPSFAYIQDIANGSKHNGITMYEPSVKNTENHSGAFSLSFSPRSFSRRSFNISGLKMVLDDGTEVFFDEEIAKAKEFLASYFVENLGENV